MHFARNSRAVRQVSGFGSTTPIVFETARFVNELRAAAIVRALIVDGSFVSTTSSPNDIDIILVLAAGHDFTADLSPLQYQIVERRKVRQKYGFDVFIAEDASPDYFVLVRFFQRVRLQPGLTKGILRIEI